MNVAVKVFSSGHRTHFFTAAATLPTPSLPLSDTLTLYLDHIIDQFQTGCITLFETNAPGPLHRHLHATMVDAVNAGWEIKLVDVANCFNPQLIGALSFNSLIPSAEILQKISLARPFQVFQSHSILQQLKQEVNEELDKRFLIIVTDISAQFFDPQLENEDPNFPVPQLEMLRHVLGILQGLATQGHCIVLTDRTEHNLIERLVVNKTPSKQIRVQESALAYVSNIHVQIRETEGRKYIKRKIVLQNHPFRKTPEMRSISTLRFNIEDERQTSLDGWFNSGRKQKLRAERFNRGENSHKTE